MQGQCKNSVYFNKIYSIFSSVYKIEKNFHVYNTMYFTTISSLRAVNILFERSNLKIFFFTIQGQSMNRGKV